MSDRSAKLTMICDDTDHGRELNAKKLLQDAVEWYGYEAVLKAMEQLMEERQRESQGKD